ncbi:hypothetical protein ONZ45_g3971 [Pleurotus djamor]|nr:hypothetical protein ONZ45_g3971 [Pleurotus djamor]
MPSPYATSESAVLLWHEQATHASVHAGSMTYGIHLSIYAVAMYHILKQKTVPWKSAAFITTLFLLGTINIICKIRFSELAWIDDRSYPGGPSRFLHEQQAVVENTVGHGTAIVATFLMDALLLYRVFVVWGKNWYIVTLPVLMYLASTALSVCVAIQAAKPHSSLWAGKTFDYGVPFWSISMTLNILLTVLLVARLLYARHKIRSALGPTYGQTYTDIVAITIEAALPYALVCLVFIILYAMKNTAEILFNPMMLQVQCLTPELIVLRVIRGRAWTSTTFTEPPQPDASSHNSAQTSIPSTVLSMVTLREGPKKRA